MDVSIGILFGMAAVLSWGTADFLVALAVRRTSVFKTFLWSQLVGLLLMSAAFLLFFGLPSLSWTIGVTLLACGTLMTIAYMSFYKGLQVGKVSVVSPIAACWPIVTVLLSISLLGEKLIPVKIVGISFAIIGAALVSFKLHEIHRMKLKSLAPGTNFASMAFLGWGIAFFLISILVSELGWFLPIFLIKIVSVVLILSYSLTSHKKIPFPKNATMFIILIGLLEVVAFLLYGLGSTTELASIIAPIGAAFPAVTIILARIFLKEGMELNQKIGVVSVIMGLVLLSI